MTLTYNDCKELKEAGFPYPDNWEDLMTLDDLSGRGKMYRPSLEHLIEACGDRFRSLTNWGRVGELGGWNAISESIDEKFISVYSDSPIQAVKNLYCALKTKNGIS